MRPAPDPYRSAPCLPDPAQDPYDPDPYDPDPYGSGSGRAADFGADGASRGHQVLQ